MKVMVTGGAGFIGSHLVDALISEAASVSVIDDKSSGNYTFFNSAARFYQASVNSDTCEDFILTEQPELIFHLAAQSDVQTSVKNPNLDADTNIFGTVRLLSACQKAGVKKVIFSSTSAVYGDLQKEKIFESDPTSPVSSYGLSKLTGERYIQLFSKLYGLDYTILRYANVYGPRQVPKGEGGVVAIFIDSIRKGLPLQIFGDGNQTRDFVYVKDVVKANLAAVNQGNGRVLHVSSGQCTTINELADYLAKIAERLLPINYLPERKGDIRHSCLLNREITKYLNWRPTVSLFEGLKYTYNYLS
jgi:UDP-glucose 4-epimerase